MRPYSSVYIHTYIVHSLLNECTSEIHVRISFSILIFIISLKSAFAKLRLTYIPLLARLFAFSPLLDGHLVRNYLLATQLFNYLSSARNFIPFLRDSKNVHHHNYRITHATTCLFSFW